MEYWRTQLTQVVEHYGTLHHPEVLRVSEVLDRCVVRVQNQHEPAIRTDFETLMTRYIVE